MHRFHRNLVTDRALAFVFIAGALGVPAGLRAATSCYNVSCATSCTPEPPVAISTLIASGDFPAHANNPTAFVDPGDQRGRRLIATREGVILVWDGATGDMLATPFLDLRDDVGGPIKDSGSEQGLLSLAVEPDYATTGRLYVFYTSANVVAGRENDIVVARYERSANPDLGNAGSATILLVIEHSGATNHNGGTLAFGPDGFLYISTGDGGPQCDNGAGASGDGQNPATLAGKILRIDVRNVDPSAGAPDDCGNTVGNYEVPSSNPFFEEEPACDEVWAMGMRNPFRMTFDRLTGDLYVGDVGQNKWEEINIKAASTPAPVNFGWVCREGCETSDNDESGCNTAGCPVDVGTTCEFPRASGYWDPILCHHNAGWLSIMSGYRYRGERVPSIAGDYIYGDNVCGQIWKTTTLDPGNPAAIASECWASGFGGTYGFAEDHLGELYVVVGGASRISCIHNGNGCFWAGFRGLFEDDFESQGTTHWSATFEE